MAEASKEGDEGGLATVAEAEEDAEADLPVSGDDAQKPVRYQFFYVLTCHIVSSCVPLFFSQETCYDMLKIGILSF